MFISNQTGLCLDCEQITPEVEADSLTYLDPYGALTVLCPFNSSSDEEFLIEVFQKFTGEKGWLKPGRCGYNRETFKEVFQYNLKWIGDAEVVLIKLLDDRDAIQPEIYEYINHAYSIGKPTYVYTSNQKFVKHPLLQNKTTYISNNLEDIIQRISQTWFE